MSLTSTSRGISTLLSAIVLMSCSKPPGDDAIIRINDRMISTGQFRIRLNSLPNTLQLSADDIKETLVCTLIAEAILRDKAVDEKLDSLERIHLLRDQYAKEAVYEEWMDAEVRSRITIEPEELARAYERFKEVRSVAFWTADDHRKAEEIRRSIAQGKPPAQETQFKDIEFGESLESVEDAIFALRDGEISEPLLIDGQFYVFELLKRQPHPQHATHDLTYWKSSVEKSLRARKEVSMVAGTLDALMKGKQYSINRKAYDILINRLTMMIFDDGRLKAEDPEFIQQEIGTREISPGDDAGRLLISFSDGGEWTVGEVWKSLSVCPYPLNYRTPEKLRHGLLDVLRKMILLESIVEDGRNKGYENTREAREQARMWFDNVLAQAMLTSYRKSATVDESEVVEYYDSTKQFHLQPELRKIVPVIVREMATAERLYNRVLKGADVDEISRNYSIRRISQKNDDVGAVVTRDTWGEIGKVAFSLKPGQVSGPFRSSDTTYAIVKLVDIRPPAPYPFDDVRGRLRSILEERRVQKSVEDLLVQVVKTYDIEINRPALKKIEYLGGGLAVRKSHFPLRNAVPSFPLFSPNAPWYRSFVTGR